jgi:hypothetical protein
MVIAHDINTPQPSLTAWRSVLALIMWFQLN